MPCDEGWQEHLKLRGVFLVDCRNDDEVVSKGRIAGALHWPCKMADDPTERVAAAASQLPYKSTPILAFCAVGGRAARFVAALRAAGYTNVANGGGFDAVSAARLVSFNADSEPDAGVEALPGPCVGMTDHLDRATVHADES